MRTKNSGVQGRRARRTRYAGCANVVCFDSACSAGMNNLFSPLLRLYSEVRVGVNSRCQSIFVDTVALRKNNALGRPEMADPLLLRKILEKPEISLMISSPFFCYSPFPKVDLCSVRMKGAGRIFA